MFADLVFLGLVMFLSIEILIFVILNKLLEIIR